MEQGRSPKQSAGGPKGMGMKKAASREREKDRGLVRRIRAAGIPIFTDTEEEEPEVEPELLIRQNSEAYESAVFDDSGGAGLMLPLQVTVNMPIFSLSDLTVGLDRLPNLWFRPLEENPKERWPHYAFYERSELKFHRDEIMNRFLRDPKEFRRGQLLHGLLLAFSADPMPREIAIGEKLQGVVKIYDQFEHVHLANFRVQASRPLSLDFEFKKWICGDLQ
jgi:hypothetical protein